jgi:hypothetical protein
VEVESNLAGRDRRNFSADVRGLAGAIVYSSATLISRSLVSVASALETGELEGVLMMSHLMYDETPMKLRLQDSAAKPGLTKKFRKGDTLTVKVFQGDLTLALLLRHVPSQRLQLVSFPFALPLLPLETNNAETMRVAIKRWFKLLPALDRMRGQFDLSIDAAVSDRAQANLRLERVLSRESPIPRLWLPCTIHQISNAQGRQHDLNSSDITGLIRLSLALRPGGALSLLKEVRFPLGDFS